MESLAGFLAVGTGVLYVGAIYVAIRLLATLRTRGAEAGDARENAVAPEQV